MSPTAKKRRLTKKRRTKTHDLSPTRLKSSAPDLKIVILYGDYVCTRWYYSRVMAMHSNYIDTMLATRMREGKTLELTLTDFPDDRPVCVWDIMVDFVTDPSKACDMTLQHALMVAETYNQYDFLQGRCLCDKVVLKYMESLKQQERDETLDIGVLVDALSISFAANLTSSYQKGSEFIQPILNQKQILEFYCPLMFSESLVEKLVPVLLDLVEKNPSFDLLPTRAVSAEDIKSRLFPRLYTAEWEAY